MEGVEKRGVVGVLVVFAGGSRSRSISPLFPVIVVGRCSLLQCRQSRMRLRQKEIQIRRLRHDKQQRHPCRRRERIGRDGSDIRQRSAQRGPARKRNAKTSPDKRHRPSALALVADIRRDRVRQLDVSFAQAAHDSTRQERPKVRCRDPQRHAEDVADHRAKEGSLAAVAVGQAPDEGSGNGLEERKEGAQSAAQQHDVIAGVDGLSKGVLVRVEVVEDAVQEGGRGGILVAIEGEQ